MSRCPEWSRRHGWSRCLGWSRDTTANDITCYLASTSVTLKASWCMVANELPLHSKTRLFVPCSSDVQNTSTTISVRWVHSIWSHFGRGKIEATAYSWKVAITSSASALENMATKPYSVSDRDAHTTDIPTNSPGRSLDRPSPFSSIVTRQIQRFSSRRRLYVYGGREYAHWWDISHVGDEHISGRYNQTPCTAVRGQSSRRRLWWLNDEFRPRSYGSCWTSNNVVNNVTTDWPTNRPISHELLSLSERETTSIIRVFIPYSGASVRMNALHHATSCDYQNIMIICNGKRAMQKDDISRA